jgi:hypothetical protein
VLGENEDGAGISQNDIVFLPKNVAVEKLIRTIEEMVL